MKSILGTILGIFVFTCFVNAQTAVPEGIKADKDFSVQFRVKTLSVNPTVFISQKKFPNKGITTQKNPGWALYSSGGTFAWSIGSGDRRISYERDNGDKMPVNDGLWHQLTMTYSKELSEVRLYYDGINAAIYKVGFDFANKEPLLVGESHTQFDFHPEFLPEIDKGAVELQELVDEFNNLGLERLKTDEFLELICDPGDLLDEKLKTIDPDRAELLAEMKAKNLDKVNDIRNELLLNPYTVHQVQELTRIKPLNRIYSLKNGKVLINNIAAKSFTNAERLYPADYEMENLTVLERVLSAEEVWQEYVKHENGIPKKTNREVTSLTIGVWNIWHGGTHWTSDENGWDSRNRIAEMIADKDVDILLMQETYSSGDFIAAELGYYFATTSDWDYRMQGSNISVLSRYPILEVEVLPETEFNNVAVKVAISETQAVWAMSNWYGMNSFPLVYDFHSDRFKTSDSVPVFFGGDFNAVPHTDGGKSPASVKMLEEGFTDAYRSLYPDVKEYPAPTHRSGSRIDQLYYKGKGLKNISTEVISSWPGGFPSDHFLILAEFDLAK